MARAGTIGDVRVYQAGTGNLLGSYSVTTDAQRRFTAKVYSSPAGTYDVSVKGSDTLSRLKGGVTLPTAGQVDFGSLLVGDSSGDDAVNGADVSYLVTSFLECQGDAKYSPYADTNRDQCINGMDVSALIPNFLKVREVHVPSGGAGSGASVLAQAAASPTSTATASSHS
jgi:hypothetical protein